MSSLALSSFPSPDRAGSNTINRRTRKNIFDGIRIAKISWSGALDEPSFLERLYDLSSLPSHDSRYSDAAGDIWQHRVNNWDWDEDWVFDDRRFRLLDCDDDEFIAFLCEMVHPVVRPEREEADNLVTHFNDQLKKSGWCLVANDRIAGRNVYSGERTNGLAHRSVHRAREAADILDAAWMREEIERLEGAADKDPALAIGTAKDLVETCCKTILAQRDVTVSPRADLPELTKMLAKELKLVPEDVAAHHKGAETVRLILRNLAVLTQYLAELRGLYGTGHGRDGKHRGLKPRHARLAVGAAVTFIDFIVATYKEQTAT